MFYGCSKLKSVVLSNNITSLPSDNGHNYADGFFENCSSLTSVTIPNSVTSIGEQAFSGCSSLTSVTIPNSVTTVGGGMFYGCSKLKSVVLSNNITSLPSHYENSYKTVYGFFGKCSSLTSVTIPNSVTSIGNSAFSGCSSLTSVTIPNSVTSIGEWAFADCSSLTTPVYNAHCFAYMPTTFEGAYVIPEGIKQIAGGAFSYCSSLTSITIPNSVTSIGSSAFNGCCSLTSVTIPNSVTSIGSSAFNGCSSLTSVIIPNRVTSIGNGAFSGCSSLTSVTIGNSVTSIGEQAFYDCSSLTSVTIPNSVTTIGRYAFEYCSSLTSVTIGNSVTSIGWYAFDGCSSLDTLTCLAMTPPALEPLSNSSSYDATLYVPCEALLNYETHSIWWNFSNIQCISSQETDRTEVIAETSTTSVTITWPTEEGADTYTIVIKKGNEVFCTLTFNAEGQLLNIAFAPGRDGNNRPTQYAEQAGKGYRFTVTGLEEGTDYTYNITVKDASNKTINSHTGAFTTQSTTAVDNITTNNANIQKMMRNGQLIILRNGVEYNAVGQEM